MFLTKDIDEVLAFFFFFGDLNWMDYMGGDYFIYLLKGEDDLTKLVRYVYLHMGMECNNREFTVSVPVPIINEKKQEYMIGVNDDVNFQYVLRFSRNGVVDNLGIYIVLKSRSDGLFREDNHRQTKMTVDDEYVDPLKVVDDEVNDGMSITKVSSSMNLDGGRRRTRGMYIVRL